MKITKIFDYFKGNKELKHEKAIENIQKKDDEEWEAIWNNIHECQKYYPADITSDEASQSDLYSGIGRDGAKVWLTKEQSNKLFLYRVSH